MTDPVQQPSETVLSVFTKQRKNKCPEPETPAPPAGREDSWDGKNADADMAGTDAS